MTWSRQQRHKARAAAPRRFTNGGQLTAEDIERSIELGSCTCWVRHGQPRPHSATCPAYVHTTGPIGDPHDLER